MDVSWEDCFKAFNDLSGEYLRSLSSRNVGQTNAHLSPTKQYDLPSEGIDLIDLIERIRMDVMPNLNAQAGPRYFAYVTGGSTPIATLADWLVTTFDQNVKKEGCSISLAIERQAIRWLVELLLLPEQFEGLFTTGCTAANLLSMISGRQYVGKMQGVDITLDGIGSTKLRVFCTRPHESIIKCLGIAGIGQRNLCYIDPHSSIDESMNIKALEQALKESGDCGKIIIASAGTVSGTAFDDLAAIGELSLIHKAWFHVDGAFGIFERLINGQNGQTKGIEHADSIAFDCHKWLNVPYDSGVCLIRDKKFLFESCYVDSPYFESSTKDPDFLALGIENSRRFRAFPVWLSLLAYGRNGIAKWIEKDISLAKKLAEWLSHSEFFELVFYGNLNVVLFRPIGKENRALEGIDEKTDNFLNLVNLRGITFVNSTVWDGKKSIRVAFSNHSTQQHDLDMICEELNRIAKLDIY